MRFHTSFALGILTSACVILGCGASQDDPASAKNDAASLVAAMVAKDDAEYDRLCVAIEEKMKRFEGKGSKRDEYKSLLSKELERHAGERATYAAYRWPVLPNKDVGAPSASPK